jgi:ATP-dependent exoDNAse (exonuclease V) beta subunit
MSTANFEQLPAIEQQGGVLLKAGAGSGKTFVLVEHMIYRTRVWREQWAEKNASSFSDFIAENFSSTVLMTFTKLAAGEILVRLTQRFQQQVETCPTDEKVWWQEALAQIDRVTVTTIDGFFYKLVRRGFFPELPPDVAIIMNQPRRKRILETFDRWWESQQENFSADIGRDTAMYRGDLIDTLLAIFNDPSLRDEWMNFSPEDAAPEKLAWLASDVAHLDQWEGFFKSTIDIRPDDRAKPTQLLALADALALRTKVASTWDDILDWGEFVDSEMGRTRLSHSKFKSHNAEYFSEWENFRDSIRKWSQTYRSYRDNFATRIYPWLKTLSHLVHRVNQALRPTDGLTYGDLEFHVLRGLSDVSIAQKIRKEFTTLVVDEFQDTSRIQYDILMILSDHRPERLFCVGDPKQAIYGFRGGELKVFQTVEDTPGIRTLLLSSNYRSKPQVVLFNNAFFKALFPLGIDWSGHDPHTVVMEPQIVPENTPPGGKVKIYQADLPDVLPLDEKQRKKKKPTWSKPLLNQAEAQVIAHAIAERLPQIENGSIAVLYRKLAPTRDMMMALMKRGIGFTAQAKIPFKDDPVAGILLALIDDHLGAKETRWSQFMIYGYLHLLGINPGEELVKSCQRFSADVGLYGPVLAFDLVLARLGLSDGLPQNLIDVRELLALSANDLEAAALRLRARAEERWSADFRFGPNAHKVILQTSHGSKGLEYDVVFVAGLATNGRDGGDDLWIGSMPGSALWVEDASDRKRSPTPQLIFEKEIEKQKDFAESKRLFYVACTRAKQELVMVQFVSQLDQYSLDKKSWAGGLATYLEGANPELQSLVPFLLTAEHFAGQVSQRPFFHMSQLGITRKEGATKLPEFGLSSELSVTGLNSLLECPRKFYFKQILKLPDDMASEEEFGYEGEVELRALSSSERGSQLHLALSEAVKNNFVLPLEWVNHKDRPNMQWALDELKSLMGEQSRLVSEEPMKFPLFGFMITGIPDLVVRGDEIEVWDYKTGRRNESTELKYWQQLMIYAWAHWSSEIVSADATITLRLCYLDSRELPTKKVGLAEVREVLFALWERLSQLDKTDESHCSVCPYRGICSR